MSKQIQRASPEKSGTIAIIAVVMFSMFVGGCRTVEESELAGWQTYAAPMSAISDSSLWPESAEWKMGTESGNGRIPKLGTSFAVGIALWDVPVETVFVDLRKGKIRYAKGAFVCEGSTRLKMVRQELDTIAAGIFRRMHPRTGDSAFDSAMAQALVDGDKLVRGSGFPAKHPYGMDTASVFREAMLIMVAKQIPLAAIAKDWALGIDTLQVHVRIRLLCEKGLVTDTSKIFPAYPVRATTALGFDSVLIRGGEAKTISGVFAARDGLKALETKVTKDGQDLTSSFAIEDSVSLRGLPKTVSLAAGLRLRALSNAPIGTYRLVVVARDDSGRTVSSSTEFKVVAAPDRDGPDIAIVAPLAGAVVPPESDSIPIEARVVDPSGVDSVWIAGVFATRTDSSWRLAKVFVPASDTGAWISVRARDRMGNSSVASVKVFRKKPVAMVPQAPASPRKSVLQPAAGQKLPFDSSRVRVVWKVVDPRAAVTGVQANGIAASRLSDTVWSVDVPVPPTGANHTVRLVAVGSNSDTLFDSVVVSRSKDTVAPVIHRVLGGRGVGVDSASALVSWSVSDNHKLATVFVNGSPVQGNAGVYGVRVDLAEGANKVRIRADDSSGNVSTDSVVVVRGAADTTAPILSRIQGTGNMTVPSDFTAATLAWSASDPSLRSVEIAGVAVVGTQGVYSRRLGLSTGRNVVYAEALDSTGNATTDSVVIVRLAKDTLGPVLVRESGTLDRAVRSDTARTSVAWLVSDAALKSVAIAGAGVAGSAGRFGSTIDLSTGRNVVRILATDSAGNVSTDSVVIVRLAKDTLDPVLARSSGTHDKTVPPETLAVAVSWTVSDASLKSVSIGSGSVEGESGTYSAEIVLATGRNMVRVRAVDSAGNVSTDSVVIVRLAKDSSRPVLVRLAGTSDRKVRFDTTTAGVAWTVSDPGLRQVAIDGKVVTGSAGTYSGTIQLSVGRNTARIEAVDSAGNISTDSVVIERMEKDVSAPVLVRLQGASDRTLRFDSLATIVSWKVTDLSLKGVTIDGVPIVGIGDIYTREITLLGASQRVVIEAIDSLGNVASDSILLSRSVDSAAPVLTRILGTNDTTVSADSTHFAVNWMATDDGVLTTVTINGMEATSDGSVFFLDVPLEPGETVITIVATDGAMHVSTDFILVKRQ